MDGAIRLRVRVGGQEVTLGPDRQLVVGRDPGADIRVDDPRVSRRHVAIRAAADGWRVADLGSSNGLYLDGNRIDELSVSGPVTLRLASPADGPAVELEPLAAAVPAAPLSAAPVVVAEPGPASGPPLGAAPARRPAPAPPAAPAGGRPPGPPETGAPTAVDLGRRVAVHALGEAVLRIGRAPNNAIVLTDPHISRSHAELRWEQASGWTVHDLGSHNGTFVNGHRISAAPLREGDVVSLGRRHLRLTHDQLEEFESGDVRLDAIDLSVTTPEGHALLQHVSLSVEKGSFVAVVGPSGAGKTTLLNALTGFRPADRGAVFYGGRNLYAEYEELRRRIGYVPQDDIVHSQLTVRKALAYAAELRFPSDVPASERERRVDEVLTELGLGERADLMIEKLSGGQRKRVNIGVELLAKPSPLFLDEPTSGLDPGLERGVMLLLRELSRGGRTVVVVTHAVQSLTLCDRVLVMAPGGRVAYYGPPEAALRYFGCSDFVEVFTTLEAGAEDSAWDQRFWPTPDYAEYVARPLASLPPPPDGVAPASAAPARTRDGRRQAGILTRRYFDTMVADRRNLAILLLQAPVVAVILLIAIGAGTFDPSSRNHGLAQVAVTVVVLVMTILGLVNAIREVVKEAPTYRRERFVGLSIPAYILSKVAVLGPLTVAQAIVIVLIGFADQSGPNRLALVLDAAFVGLAAVALGLMISAMMRSTDKAISVLILALVVQLVIAMPILDLVHKPVVGQLSWLFSARWGVDAVASTVNLNRLQPMGNPPSASYMPEWAQGFWPWSGEILMLIVLSLACVAGAMWLLRRQDPTLLTGTPGANRRVRAQAEPAAAG